MILQM